MREPGPGFVARAALVVIGDPGATQFSSGQRPRTRRRVAAALLQPGRPRIYSLLLFTNHLCGWPRPMRRFRRRFAAASHLGQADPAAGRPAPRMLRPLPTNKPHEVTAPDKQSAWDRPVSAKAVIYRMVQAFPTAKGDGEQMASGRGANQGGRRPAPKHALRSAAAEKAEWPPEKGPRPARAHDRRGPETLAPGRAPRGRGAAGRLSLSTRG